MNRPLHRGSSPGRIPESTRIDEDTSLRIQVNGKIAEDGRLHGQSIPSPHSLRLLMRQANQEYSLAGSFESPPKPQHRSSDNGFKHNSRTPDNSMSSDPHPLKSSVQCVEIRSLASQASLPNSILSVSSSPVRNRRGLALPLGQCMMLCFVSVFVLIGLLRSSGPAYSLSLVPRLAMYKSYRRLQQEIPLDLINGGIFGQGTVRSKELGLCPKDMEEYVPCYNISLSLEAGFRNGEEYDRHCELSGRRRQCLIQPPQDYKIPLRWPACRDRVWSGNLQSNGEQLLSRGTMSKRLMLVEENLIAFQSEDAEIEGWTENYSKQIATMIGLEDASLFNQAGVRKVLDINCGFGGFGAHLFSKNILTLCLAPYEVHGSQVQIALERGLPAMVGSLTTRQLPFSRSSFDMIHCSECGVDWTLKDGILLMEVDRILRPGGYFIWTSPSSSPGEALLIDDDKKNWEIVEDLANRICWPLLTRQNQTSIWRKTTNHTCYISRGIHARPKMCDNVRDANSTWYPLLRPCIVGAPTDKWIPGKEQELRPDSIALPAVSFVNNGFSNEELLDDSHAWSATVKSYWSLLTPLIFSDHPKRPGEDDPSPPSNMVHNVMDMNAVYGSLNAALVQAGKSAWVMNVVPLSGPDTLSTIYSRGFVGALHDWCEAFPTYPRTYDLLHAIGLLSQEVERSNGCGLSNLFLEMDRILRPEGWVLLRDKAHLIEDARIAAAQMRWESRVVEVDGDSDLQLLVCQKIFWKN